MSGLAPARRCGNHRTYTTRCARRPDRSGRICEWCGGPQRLTETIKMAELTLNQTEDLAAWRARLEERVLAPLRGTGWRYFAWLAFLLMLLGWALYAYSRQLENGLIVTNMRDRISWGLYIASFVFFIGISHAGTLLSAILRVTRARWQMPIT